MFHQFRSDWFDIFHLDIMVDITYLQLFLFHEAVKVWTVPVHIALPNKIIMKTKINKKYQLLRLNNIKKFKNVGRKNSFGLTQLICKKNDKYYSTQQSF